MVGGGVTTGSFISRTAQRRIAGAIAWSDITRALIGIAIVITAVAIPIDPADRVIDMPYRSIITASL